MGIRLKKGDLVEVIRGEDRGRRGKVLSAYERGEWVTVEKVAVVKRHQRPTPKFPGGIVEKLSPFRASKVMLVCPKCEKPSRIRWVVQEKEKTRQCKECDATIV